MGMELIQTSIDIEGKGLFIVLLVSTPNVL
jgi:hypothetical protein